MLQIRTYQNQDRPQIELICASEHNPMREAFLQCFCRYYLDQEPDNCFVCADDAGKVHGYVLCAADFTQWELAMRADYLKNDPVCLAIGNATIENLRPFSSICPAHLHIDLLPESQGRGLGTKLMEMLIAHLRDAGIPGLMLDVAADNTGAQRFYQKNGFIFLDKDDHSCRMGMQL